MVIVALSSAAALAACGSGHTKTVTVSDTAPSSTQSAAQATVTNASTETSATSTSQTTTSQSSSGGSTSGGPAFAQPSSGGLATAEGALKSRGYTAIDSSQYRSQQTLQVLIGSQTQASGAQEQAFFFVNGKFIGTDTKLPSQQISVIDQADTEITLAYTLYGPNGATAGQAEVRYQLNNGELTPLDPIPSASPTVSPTRR
jgi:hypothetical protein